MSIIRLSLSPKRRLTLHQTKAEVSGEISRNVVVKSDSGSQQSEGAQVAVAVPAGRLGPMLRFARESRGLSLDQLAGSSRGGFAADQLRLYERAELGLNDDIRLQLAELYDIDLRPLSGERVPVIIDHKQHRVVIGTAARSYMREGQPEDVLRTYLSLVQDLRGTTTRFLTLRNDDITALALQLELAPSTVIEHVADIVDAPASDVVKMRRLYLSGAAIALAIGLGIGSTGIAQDSRVTSPTSTVVSAQPTTIDREAQVVEAVTIERPVAPDMVTPEGVDIGSGGVTIER
jgi:hypothetical protein